jgi:hypothetical protein
MGLCHSGQGTVAESCEHGNKLSTSTKGGKFDSCGLIDQHVPVFPAWQKLQLHIFAQHGASNHVTSEQKVLRSINPRTNDVKI